MYIEKVIGILVGHFWAILGHFRLIGPPATKMTQNIGKNHQNKKVLLHFSTGHPG